MGLCKCPKRKVTNLFCFEHRVNVCEYCLIENHPRCIVQSYLNWLKDSDYSPNCALCNISLTQGEVVRLLCYDVFHLNCLEKHYRALPSNTAPAGYRCFACDFPVFPASNQAGYVTDKLRDVLSKYNWARVGLCLPLIEEPSPATIIDDETPDDPTNESLHGFTIPPPSFPSNDSFSSDNHIDNYHPQSNFWDQPMTTSYSGHRQSDPVTTATILSIGDVTPSHDDDDVKAVSRKLLSGTATSSFGGISLGTDPDGPDKYKRRSAFSWLRRWLKSRMLRGRGYNESRALPRRTVVLFLIGLLAFLTFIVISTKVGRRSNPDDPDFDPHFNPNVHIARPKMVESIYGDSLDAIDPLQAVQPAAGGR